MKMTNTNTNTEITINNIKWDLKMASECIIATIEKNGTQDKMYIHTDKDIEILETEIKNGWIVTRTIQK